MLEMHDNGSSKIVQFRLGLFASCGVLDGGRQTWDELHKAGA